MKIMRKIRSLTIYPWQRSQRGFSDMDMWNADTYLAGLYAEILMWYVHKGMGVPASYADSWETDIDIMQERRDIDYYKYADIFRRYASGYGVWDAPEHVKEFGGVLDKDMDEALEWFRNHFYEFWD